MELIMPETRLDYKSYGIALAMLIVLCSLAITGRAKIMMQTEDIPGIPSISPLEYEAIRAGVTNNDPGNFTIDVRKFANIGANEDAPVFALYFRNTLPKKCGDFRGLDLSYWKSAKYKRSFNLNGHDDVITAMNSYGCIVIDNPAPPPAATEQPR